MGKLILIERERMMKALNEFDQLLKKDQVLREEMDRFKKQHKEVIRRRDAAAAKKRGAEEAKEEVL